MAALVGLSMLVGCSAEVSGYGVRALESKGTRIGGSGIRLLPDGTTGPTVPDMRVETDAGLAPVPPGGAAGCQGLDYLGMCSGQIARWCDEQGIVREKDCAAEGRACGHINDAIGFYCMNPGGTTPPPGGTAPPGTTAPPGGSPTSVGCDNPIHMEELALTNSARGTPLVCDEKLTAAAYGHSKDMCDQGYFDHTGRDGSDFAERARRAGANISTGGENIAWGQQTPNEVHQSWMSSPGHHANIVNPAYRKIGIGYVECNGSPLWTQVFSD